MQKTEVTHDGFFSQKIRSLGIYEEKRKKMKKNCFFFKKNAVLFSCFFSMESFDTNFNFLKKVVFFARAGVIRNFFDEKIIIFL